MSMERSRNYLRLIDGLFIFFGPLIYQKNRMKKTIESIIL
jgi:hypothetical protein